jgi:SAM-dependent methyltransferase
MKTTGTDLIPEIVPAESWDEEFVVKHSIPSSTRQEPAKALLLFSELLHLGPSTRVLDAGSGNGRNAIYLAKRGCKVTAVDFADSAISATRRSAKQAGLEDNIVVVKHSIDDPLPFPDHSFDFVLDAYTFCHFLGDAIGQRFWSAMSRVVRPRGQLLSIAFSPEDEYYAQFLADGPDGSLVRDPSNGIWKRLYTEDQIRSLFSPIFELQYFTRFEFSDIVFGESYRRVVFASVLRNTLQ